MFNFPTLLYSFQLISYALATSQCKITIPRSTGIREFNCMELFSLRGNMEKAPINTTAITVINSQISVVPGFSFSRFGTTLETLDLHTCGITAIDVNGFAGLVQLQKLVLWENKLTWISGDWFKNLANLRHLDVSFNQIIGIDNVFYQMLPNLETFYFDYNQLQTLDYNMFPLLSHLKTVKFGKNPWNWGYRILLTWQLDNQRVDYRDDWEEWAWMSSNVRECQDNRQGSDLNDNILECVILSFLRMESEYGLHGHTLDPPKRQKQATAVACFNEATALINCPVQSASGRDAIRRTLEGLTAILKGMRQPNGSFDIRTC